MSECPKKPPTSWREVINELVTNFRMDKVTRMIIISWMILIAIFICVKFSRL
jgi:hypothetical protein